MILLGLGVAQARRRGPVAPAVLDLAAVDIDPPGRQVRVCHLHGTDAPLDDARDHGVVAAAVGVVVEEHPGEASGPAVGMCAGQQDVLVVEQRPVLLGQAANDGFLDAAGARPDVGDDDRDARVSRRVLHHERPRVQRRFNSGGDLILVGHADERQTHRGISDVTDPRADPVHPRHTHPPVAPKSCMPNLPLGGGAGPRGRRGHQVSGVRATPGTRAHFVRRAAPHSLGCPPCRSRPLRARDAPGASRL